VQKPDYWPLPNISQGSVATCSRCSGTFNDEFIMNEFNGEIVLILILKLTVERFLHNSEWFLRNFALYNKQLKFTWIDMQSILQSISISALPLVLWHCWLGGRKGIRHIKTEWWVLAWLSIWNKVKTICIWSSSCHCHPIISCSSKIQNGLLFLTRLSWKKDC